MSRETGNEYVMTILLVYDSSNEYIKQQRTYRIISGQTNSAEMSKILVLVETTMLLSFTFACNPCRKGDMFFIKIYGLNVLLI